MTHDDQSELIEIFIIIPVTINRIYIIPIFCFRLPAFFRRESYWNIINSDRCSGMFFSGNWFEKN